MNLRKWNLFVLVSSELSALEKQFPTYSDLMFNEANVSVTAS